MGHHFKKWVWDLGDSVVPGLPLISETPLTLKFCPGLCSRRLPCTPRVYTVTLQELTEDDTYITFAKDSGSSRHQVR